MSTIARVKAELVTCAWKVADSLKAIETAQAEFAEFEKVHEALRLALVAAKASIAERDLEIARLRGEARPLPIMGTVR